MLAGRFGGDATFARDDFRSTLPKFQGDNLTANAALVGELTTFARERGHTPGQVALARLLAQPYDIVPIPGARRLDRVRENLAATSARLGHDDVAHLNELFAPARVRDGRYGDLHTTGK